MEPIPQLHTSSHIKENYYLPKLRSNRKRTKYTHISTSNNHSFSEALEKLGQIENKVKTMNEKI